MAKKFVRGVTGVDDIESFDKTLTNVNDLISDGQNTYVHTKKGKNEFYYKVTDGVTSVNSTGATINVEKSDDGLLKLDVNPQKVLQHENLVSISDYVTINHDDGSNTSQIETGKLDKNMNQIYSSLAQKQSKLTAGEGILILNDTISIKSFNGFKDDLNTLTFTCIAVPIDNTNNLPNGAKGYGILNVIRTGDVVEQTYQTYTNEGRYVRTGYQFFSDNPIWTPWNKIVTQPLI